MRARLDALAIFVFVLGVYAATLAPGWGAVTTFNNWDGLELLLCARLGGVDHPPGHPLYLLVARGVMDIFFFLPPRLAVNMFSAVCSALCVTLVYLVGLDTIRLALEEVPTRLHRAAAAVAALVLGFSAPFWQHAVIPGAYPLYLCLLAATLVAAARWLRDGQRRALLLLGLMGGLMLSTNVLNALTALAPLLPLTCAWGRRDVRGWLGAGVLLLVGVSAYAWYPAVIGAGAGFVQPMALQSSHPFGSVAWLGWYISGEVWTGQRMFAVGRIPHNLPNYLIAAGGPTVLLGLGAVLGSIRGIFKWRWPAMLCVVWATVALPQLAIEDPSNLGAVEYLARFYLPSLVVAAPLAALSLAWLLDRLPLPSRQEAEPLALSAWQLLLAYAALCWPLLALAQNQAVANLRFEDSAAAWARAIYATLPQDAVIYSPLVHGQLLPYFERIEPIVAGRNISLVRPPAAALAPSLTAGRPVFVGGDAVDRDKAPEYGLLSSLIIVPQLPAAPPAGAHRPFSGEVALYRVQAVRAARPLAAGDDLGQRGVANDGTFSDVLRLLGIRVAEIYPLPDGRQVLAIDLNWQVLRAPEVDLIGAFRLVDEQHRPTALLTPERIFTVGGTRPTSTWKAGERLTDRVSLFLPPLAEGRYLLALGLGDAAGHVLQYWPAGHRDGQPGFDSVLLTPIQSGPR